MDIIERYNQEQLQIDLEENLGAERFISEFTKDYPREKIMDMDFRSYLYAPKGFGFERSFCYRLMYSHLASMGSCHPDIFGVYLKGGHTYMLSSTYKKIFGNDYECAFAQVKKDIVSLFEAADRLDFEAIDSNRLNSAFKGIMLATYFPDDFFPAPTLTALNAYCDAVGIATDRKLPTLYRNHLMVKWKNKTEELQPRSTFLLMRFCDWLWVKKDTIDGKSLTVDSVARVKKIEKEIEGLNLNGSDREAIVRVRVNQGEFRDRLLSKYDKCCLCGVSDSRFLVASHIKPWVESSPEEKLDVDNGFLLCPAHDKLFDLGFISFADDGSIIISDELSQVERVLMNAHDDMKISLTEKNKEYLEYHRRFVFKNHTIENK